MHGHTPRNERLAGGCRACKLTIERLDALLDAAVTREIEMDGTERTAARQHALALMASYWLDRTLETFANDGSGPKAARLCLRNVFREQGLDNTHDVLERLAAALEQTPREGADTDEPEGARTVRLSDTVARALVQAIRRELGAA